MKILFVNRFFYPDHSATSQMLSDLAFALAGRGYAVEVVTSSLSYDGSERFKARENIGGVTIVRLPGTGFGRARLLGRSLDYLSFYLAALASLLWRVRAGDIVVAKTDPPMLSLLSAPICALKGAAQINWLQDLFPEVAEALGIGKGRVQKTGLALLRALRNASLKSAHMNIVLGERMAAKLKSLGLKESQIKIIANWADGCAIRSIEAEHNRLRKEWGFGRAFVVGYSGNLGRAHDWRTFLAAIEALEGKALAPDRAAAPGPQARAPLAEIGEWPALWLFIGGGAGMEALKREAERRLLKSIVFQPYQPRELLSDSLSLPDLHLISLRPELEGLIVPSKYYGIAAAGRPAIFVGDPGGEIARLLEDSASGSGVAQGDGEGLARAILALAGDPELAARQGERARALFEARFDLPLAIEAFEAVLADAACATKAGAAKAKRAGAGRGHPAFPPEKKPD